jgi:hypothetical protein
VGGAHFSFLFLEFRWQDLLGLSFQPSILELEVVIREAR